MGIGNLKSPSYSRPSLHLSSRVLIIHVPFLKAIKPHPQIPLILILIKNIQRYNSGFSGIYYRSETWKLNISQTSSQKILKFWMKEDFEMLYLPLKFYNFLTCQGYFHIFSKIWKITILPLARKSNFYFLFFGFVFCYFLLFSTNSASWHLPNNDNAPSSMNMLIKP